MHISQRSHCRRLKALPLEDPCRRFAGVRTEKSCSVVLFATGVAAEELIQSNPYVSGLERRTRGAKVRRTRKANPDAELTSAHCPDGMARVALRLTPLPQPPPAPPTSPPVLRYGYARRDACRSGSRCRRHANAAVRRRPVQAIVRQQR